MAHNKIINNGLTLNFTLGDGTGDQILTVSATGEVKAIPAITTPLSASLTNGNIFVGNGSNIATGVTPSGDITLTNTGVFGIATGVIVNADINASAAIAVSKLAALTASRAVVSDGSGILTVSPVTSTELGYSAGVTSGIQAQIDSKQATITGAATTIVSSNLTANRAVVSGATGKVEVHPTTTLTQIGYLTGVTSAIQTQLNTLIVSKATSSTLQSPGAGQQGFVISWDNSNSRFDLTSVSASGVPNGGTTNQILRKIDNVDQNTEWHTLVFSDLTDVSGTTVTEINLLNGMTVGSTQLNTLTGIGGNVQTQLDNKLSSSLTTDNIYVGVAGVATATTNLPSATTIGGAAIYRAGGTDVALADGGTGASLADPGADRIMFWDDSASQVTWLTPGTNLSITGTTLNAASGVADANYGDITVTSSGTVWTINNSAVTYAKIQNASAGLSLLGRSANSSGVYAEITAASDNQILRRSGTSIGFGSIDLSQSNSVGSSILPIANGGTGASSFPGWLLASGGTLTGANTIAMATNNVNFLNGNLLSGPTGATITANTRLDVRGINTGNIARFANDTNTVTWTFNNSGGLVGNSNACTITLQSLFNANNNASAIWELPVGVVSDGIEIRGNSSGVHNSTGDYLFIGTTAGYTRGSGSDTYTHFRIRPSINTTTTYAGNAYMLDINPVLTSTTGLTLYGVVVRPTEALNGFSTATPLSGVDINTSMGRKVSSITTTTTLDATHNVILADATGGSFTLNLPAAASSTRRIYTILKTNTTNTVTIDGNASETINGSTTQAITTQYVCMTIACDGTAWYIIGN